MGIEGKTHVLFLHSQDQIWAPFTVHSLLMRHFDRRTLEVHAACSKGTEFEKSPTLSSLEAIPDVHVLPMHFGPSIFQKSMVKAIKSIVTLGLPMIPDMIRLILYIKRNHIDIIHALDKPRAAIYGLIMAKLTGKRLIIHAHSKFGSWIGPSIFWPMKLADGVIAVSNFVAQSAISRGYPSKKLYTVLNGVDAGLWNFDTDPNIVRNEFNITPNTPLLAIISRIYPQKGHELLLRALAMIKSDVPDIRLLVVGDDDPDYKTLQHGRGYTDTLKDLVNELGLNEHVIFTNHRTDVQHVLAACDIFTMPSSDEACPMAILEAMAMKKPVIALDSGGMPEIVERGESGFLSAPGNIAELSENIFKLIKEPELRKRMGECGRQRVEQDFNLFRLANDVEQVYKLVLKEK